MDKKEGTADFVEQSSPATLAPPTVPLRRRSKLACDTCHYRKIKCDVEKCHPCKNCEKSAVQCTLVGPTMRPPRNISGSSSAAAAAAVAMAMATAAAANAQSGTGAFNGLGIEGASTEGDGNAVRPVQNEDQSVQSTSTNAIIGQDAGGARPPGLLVRRASASGQLMRVDDDVSTNAREGGPQPKRSLMSSSSSPTSLRTLFNAGAATDDTSITTSVQPLLQSGSTTISTVEITSTMETKAAGDEISMEMNNSNSNSNSSTNFDYFDTQIPYSVPSSSSSTPSGAAMASGATQFNYPLDTSYSTVAHLISPLSSPLCHAQASLPPTPLHFVAERLPESLLASSPGVSLTRFPPGNTQFQSSTAYSRHGVPRRASSSSFLPSHTLLESEPKTHHDRRTSAPWAGYGHSQSPTFDGRTFNQMQQQQQHQQQQQQQKTGPSGSHSLPYSALRTAMGRHATTDDIPHHPPQSALMRSNSTPAALRSPLKALNRNRHSALPSRRSHAGSSRQSLNLYASTDKVIQDLSLPQQLYRHSALPQRHTNSMSHLQFQLHLQQLQLSQQNAQNTQNVQSTRNVQSSRTTQQTQQQQQAHHSQRSQSLPRFQQDRTRILPSQRQHQQQHLQQSQQYQMPWLGFQETDVRLDMGASGTHPSMPNNPFSPGNILMRHSEPTTNVISSVGVQSPTQLDAADFQSLSSAMSTGFDPTLTDTPGTGSTSLLGAVPQTDFMMQQQQSQDQQRLPRDQTPKLQFAAGYMWRQEEGSERALQGPGQGHARHQSASQVYSQQQMHLQSSQQKAMLTRSLQDLSHYASPHQQRLAEQAGLLRDEPLTINPPTVEQGMAQDTFDASLALVLDDHLSLLDDMEVVPELNEYEEMADSTLTSSVQMNESNSLPASTVPLGLEQPLVGAIPVYHNIQGTTTHTHDTIIMSTEEFKEGISNVEAGANLFHFQGDPYYMDTLSFLDLSGNFMQSTATMSTGSTTAASTSATATSSSLPNTSFLDQQAARIYQGLVPNFHAQAPLPPGLNVPSTQHGQHAQDQPPPQQHIVHHQHHHHHHVHLH